MDKIVLNSMLSNFYAPDHAPMFSAFQTEMVDSRFQTLFYFFFFVSLKSSFDKHGNGHLVVKSIQQHSNKCHSFWELEFLVRLHRTWKIKLNESIMVVLNAPSTLSTIRCCCWRYLCRLESVTWESFFFPLPFWFICNSLMKSFI